MGKQLYMECQSLEPEPNLQNAQVGFWLFCISGPCRNKEVPVNYQKRIQLFEAAKRELWGRKLPPEEYEKEIKKLCQKFKV